MQFSVQQFISNFIQDQYPRFYEEEGPNFILFMEAYFEWMEQQGSPIGEARQLYNYRDIDNTLDKFLPHFQRKYLYGIPFNVIINLRFLLKHVLDVYRSKGSIQGYGLLFRLLYNLDSKVYLPAIDILKPSHGTWVTPRYLEVSDNGALDAYINYGVIGLSSNTQAVVESYIREAIGGNIINTLYLSNVTPPAGLFIPGERVIINTTGVENAANVTSVTDSTIVFGSLSSMNVLSSSAGFQVGDVLGVAHIDPITGLIVSQGVGGFLRVTGVQPGDGQVVLTIIDGGFGYSANATSLIYRGGTSDTTGSGATFDVFQLSFATHVTYNNDILFDYANTLLNASTFGFPLNPSGNVSSNLNSILTFSNNIFGTISELDVETPGSKYTLTPKVFVESTLQGQPLPGSVSYTTSSNVVTISGAGAVNALAAFASNNFIYLQANSTNAATGEYQVIVSVTNSTSLILYGTPAFNSTASAKAALAPAVFPANFALYEPLMSRVDRTINGLNANIGATSSFGNNVVASVIAIDSGKGYIAGEPLNAYLAGSVTTPLIVVAGNNYTNGDSIIFSGGGTTKIAVGTVGTNGNGNIISTGLTDDGSGYDTIPSLFVRSNTGSGGVLSTTLTEFNTLSKITGTALVSGMGVQPGFWSTTRGFLNADKYIQDSFFYQDFSYEIKTAKTLSQYESILYNTFHTSGTQLFGEFLLVDTSSSPAQILSEPTVG